jgi:hypothetical protein
MTMGLNRTNKGRHSSWIAAALLAGVSLVALPASAEPVTATGKGITGGVLLGAELGMLPQGLAGVDKWWTYLLGGGVGAVAGGVGGYFVETKLTSAAPSLYMLAGGMALIIPTVVVTLNATAYSPEAEEGETVSEDSTSEVSEATPDSPTEAAPGDAAPPAGASPAPAAPPAAAPLPGAMPAPAPQSKRLLRRRPTFETAVLGFDFSGAALAVRPGIPAVEVKPLYDAREVAQYGVAPGTQVTIPALSGRF